MVAVSGICAPEPLIAPRAGFWPPPSTLVQQGEICGPPELCAWLPVSELLGSVMMGSVFALDAGPGRDNPLANFRARC